MRSSPPTPKDRAAKLLSRLKIATGKGLEFGPLDKPLVRTSEGNIRYVDAKPTEELRQWLPGSNGYKPNDYVEIDYVWTGGNFREIVGPQIEFDYAIASHVIEHVPNMIGWVNDIESVLAEDGILSLAVPNKRYTLDRQRQETGCAQIIDDWLRNSTKPRASHVFDHYAHVVRVEKPEYDALWRGDIDPATLSRHHTEAEALALATRAIQDDVYTDCHAYVFTPESFLRITGTLIALGIWRLRVLDFYDTEQGGHEFVALLQKPPAGIPIEQIQAEAKTRIAELIEQLHTPDAIPRSPEHPSPKPAIDPLLPELAAIYRSTSWRITAPLRAAKRIFGRSA